LRGLLLVIIFYIVGICYASSVVVELSPSNVNVDAGNVFYLDIDIKNIPSDTKCGGFEATISYNPNLLNLTNIQLSSVANTANLKDINVDEGKIKLLWFSNYPSGNFTIATLTFKAVSDGNTTVSLNNIAVSDENGVKYPTTTKNANITINPTNQTVGKIILKDFAYNKDIDAVIHVDGAKIPIYNISGNITFTNINVKGNPTVLIPFNTSTLTNPNTNTIGFFIIPKNSSSKYFDLIKIPINIPNPNYNITLNLFINGERINKTVIETPTSNLTKFIGFVTEDSLGEAVENINITFGTSKKIKLKVFNIDENITKIEGKIFINTSVFNVRDYEIPVYSNIHNKVNYSNISLNGSYLLFNISLLNATNGTFSIVEFTISPKINENISSKIYVANLSLYANKTIVVLPTKSLTVQVVKRGNNTPPTGKIALSIRNNRVVDFYALSYDPDDEELKYYWDFGDGTNSTQQNPTHIYKNYTDYTVKLTIKDSFNATFSAGCVISIRKYEPLNYTFTREKFVETEKNKTTYLNLFIKNPLNWRVNAYIDFVDYGDINISKTHYNFELNPNETKHLSIPIKIEKTSTIKWNLVFYPEITDRYNKNPELSYYVWEYSKKIEVLPPTIVKINEITKYINLNATNVILKINKNKVFKDYVVNKTIKLDLVAKRDVVYYCLASIIGFIAGLILIRMLK